MRADQAMLALFTALAVVACGKSPEPWTAFVYPTGVSNQKLRHAERGHYLSLEDCHSAAAAALRAEAPEAAQAEVGSYECGRSCHFDSDLDMYVCHEVRQWPLVITNSTHE